MSDHNDKPTVDPGLLARFRENPPDHRSITGAELIDALYEVVVTSDYNTTYPGSPIGRPLALDGLKRLQRALEEAYNVVPGVDVPERNGLHVVE